MNEWHSWVAICRMPPWSTHVGVVQDIEPWIQRHGPQILNQFVVSPYYPEEASAVEVVTTQLRHWFEDRSFSFRNQSRTNLLLELMTAELAGKATTRNYQKRIAKEIGTLKLVPLPRHLIYASSRLH